MYLTVGAIGGLVGLFVAGLLVALEVAALGVAFPGERYLDQDWRLAGASLALVFGGIGLGLLLAGMAQGATWMWGSLGRSQRARRSA